MATKSIFFKNSDLKVNRFFAKPEFKAVLDEAKRHGKDIFYNEVRKLNNCYKARMEQGEITLKDIFEKKWNGFKEKYASQLTREGIIESINDFVSCHNFEKGYLYFECPSCKQFYIMGFSCHSRMCPSCGKKYRDQRTIKVSEKCLEVPHRQFVFTIPEDLRIFFRQHRKPLLNILFKSVDEAFNTLLKHQGPNAYKKEKRRLGYISFLHTFGRDMKWHPHIHVLIAEKYLNNKGELKKFDYFSFDFLRKAYQNILFHEIYQFYKTKRPNEEKKCMYKLLKKLKEKYTKGNYVYGRKFAHKKTTTKDIVTMTNYIARYASHPAISERRISSIDYEKNIITWYYDPHEDDDVEDEEKKIGRQYITEDIYSFMKKIIIHIPDKGFQQIRYYGFYSNKFKNKIKNSLLFSEKQLTKMKRDTMWVQGLKKTFGYDPTLCRCGTQMLLNFELSMYKGDSS
jgi:hypothetical protein